MSCCDQRPAIVAGGNLEAPPFVDMNEVRVYRDLHAALMKCRGCGQLWLVDAFDRYADLVAVQVDRKLEDREADEALERARESCIVSQRGGYSEDLCSWRGCSKKAIRGMIVCYEHSPK